MARYADLDAVADDVYERGVVTISAREIRNAYGAERLGVNVRSAIRQELRARGLTLYPPRIPDSQGDMVRIYQSDGPVGDLIQAVMRPDPSNDFLLREAALGEARVLLETIRNLLEEHDE